MIDQEYITCAAIWYKDLASQSVLPKNISYGVVVCGHRHHNVINTVTALTSIRSALHGNQIQGFMTSLDRFVDREEGLKIATAANQIKKKHGYHGHLFSEDIY